MTGPLPLQPTNRPLLGGGAAVGVMGDGGAGAYGVVAVEGGCNGAMVEGTSSADGPATVAVGVGPASGVAQPATTNATRIGRTRTAPRRVASQLSLPERRGNNAIFRVSVPALVPTPVHIHLTRRLPHPRDEAYAWLTDFEDSDAERAGAVVEKRHVTQRAKDRIVYEGEQVVLGRRTSGTTEVTLQPPDRWEARVLSGVRTGSFTHYRLVPDGAGSHLSVDYHFTLDDPTRMLLLRIAKPLVARELGKMWDGFVASMASELKRV